MSGTNPNFDRYDILRCLLLVHQNISSRFLLTKNLEIGEGSTRTILDILKSKNVIASTRKGHSLTSKGVQVINSLFQRVHAPKFVQTKLIPALSRHFQLSLLLKTSNPIKPGLMQRDIAIKKGADAALLLSFNIKLSGVGIEGQSLEELGTLYKYKKNNILIVTYAETKRTALNSALAVAESVNKELKEIIDSVSF